MPAVLISGVVAFMAYLRSLRSAFSKVVTTPGLGMAGSGPTGGMVPGWSFSWPGIFCGRLGATRYRPARPPICLMCGTSSNLSDSPSYLVRVSKITRWIDLYR